MTGQAVVRAFVTNVLFVVNYYIFLTQSCAHLIIKTLFGSRVQNGLKFLFEGRGVHGVGLRVENAVGSGFEDALGV